MRSECARRLEIEAMFAELSGADEYEDRVFSMVQVARAQRAVAAKERYHAMLPEQRRTLYRHWYETLKASPQRLEKLQDYRRHQYETLKSDLQRFEQRRQRQYKAIKADPKRLEQHRAKSRQGMRKLRAAASSEERERKRADTRERMRKQRAALKQDLIAYRAFLDARNAKRAARTA